MAATQRTGRFGDLKRTGGASPALNEPDACGILERTASLEHGTAAPGTGDLKEYGNVSLRRRGSGIWPLAGRWELGGYRDGTTITTGIFTTTTRRHNGF